MSPRSAASISDSRRTARIVLATVASLLVMFVLFASGPGIGGISLAQTPTPTSGFSIQFINPSTGGPGNEASAKPEQDSSAPQGYHLVAWVNNVPEGATVEFKYVSGSDPEVTITESATQTGDTFEYFWDLANVPEGEFFPEPEGPSTIELRAILYENGREVARDEEPLYVNNEGELSPDPSAEERAETVEILYPDNGVGWGTYDGVGVIDVTWSEGTTFLFAYYSVSPVGTEPEWIQCGNEDDGDAEDGIRCELDEAHTGDDVTAVAARANDTNAFTSNSAFNDSGDAHRVSGYVQDPTAVTMSAAARTVNPNASGDYPCSPTITGLVTDQFGNRIVGINSDVHAARPTDNLFFDDDESSEDDRSKAPDENHAATEKTVNCESDTVPPPFTTGSSLQGEHEVSGPGDIKHIETTSGTNDSGTFSFELNNRSQTVGVTDITMWADQDGDDRLCSAEARGHISIGWGTTPTADAPASSDDVATCPQPTQTTASPTPTESSPSPDPSESSPDPEDPRGCTLSGDDSDNTLRGTSGRDVICGNGGDDVIYGLGGDDLLYGDAGNDTVVGGTGNDEMFGGDHDDLMRGGGDNDTAFGGRGNDTINGKSGDDRLRGNGGRDILTGGDGFDHLKGNSGKDVLKGGEHNDRLVGGAQGDVLRGLNGNDKLYGQGGPDALNGGRHSDLCRGGRGRDRERNCER